MSARTRAGWFRQVIAGVGLAALAGVGLTAVTPATATAAEEATPATATADALPTWQINGVVYSQAIVGDTVYVTGSFTRARPPGVAAGGAGEVVANNIFAFSLSTGNRVSSFNHSLNAQGLVIKASPDGSRIYVGGDFTTVDGVARGHLAAFTTATGALIGGGGYTPPNIGGQVRGLAVTAGTLYVGGNFPSANGATRTRLAAFSNANGAMLPWAPSADGGYVWTMTMTPDNSKVVVGGSFTSLTGVPAVGMGAADAATGATLPWAANEKIKAGGSAAAITSLKADGQRVYGSGYAFVLGNSNANFEGTFGLNPTTGAIDFVNDCLGDTYDVAPVGQLLYAVSHYHDCSAVDAWPDTNPRSRWQKAVVTTNYPTDLTTKNDAYGWDYRGYQYAKLLHWYPNLAFGSYTPASQAAWAVDASGDYVVMGGEFPRVNGVAQQGLTRFRGRAAAPNKSGPTYSTTPPTPTPTTNAVSLAAGSVRVSWGSAWDMDDPTLTYDVLRDNNTWVYSTPGNSNFWTLPKMGFVDKNLPVGSTHRYQVRITDPNGNVLWSPVSNTVTVSNGSPSAYADTVTGDGASHLWRLGEPSGSSALDWAGFDDDTLSGGYTRAQGGAISGDSDGATAFNGSDAFAVNSAMTAGPDVFTVEAWFKTTSTTGGKIVSFGDQPTGTSNNYDRHVYMSPDGKVWFGVWNNGAYTVNTSNSLNDGQWHQVVGTMDATGPTLYVDGKKIGHNGGTSSAQPYNGYWRIGGDSAWNGNPYFNGTIDDVAIYPTALPLAKVQSHYMASGRPLDVPTRPTDAYGQAVWDANPDLYWRLGDSNSTAKDSGPNESNGIYQGGYAQGQAGAFDPANNKAVAFDGNNGFVASAQQYSNPRTYSLEAWFKTTSSNGGKIIGFGCSQTGTSGCYDRHIYVNNDGRVTFGVWTGFTNTITTANALNDGQWHYVVATQNTTDGMKLYVDGTLAGTNGQTDAQAYDGYWRVGGDNHWGCCSAFLDGTIDEAAVYSSVLSASTVQQHYGAGGGAVPNQTPMAAFTHTESGLSTSVDGTTSSDPDGTIASYSWDWGDGTSAGSGATASHPYGASGTYTVTLTVTDNGGATNTKAQTVTVTAPPPNQDPTASFTHGENGLTTSVDGSGSSDPDGTIASYSWNWGDGTAAGSGATTSHPYAATGTYTVSLTVTDNGGATNTKTQTVTVTAPPADPAYAKDAFGRTTTNGWGNADLGGAWTVSGTLNRWSVGNGVGNVSLAAGSSGTASLPSVAKTDTEVSAVLSPSTSATGGGQYLSVLARQVSTNNDYRGKLQVRSGGSVTLVVTKMVAGTETTLSTTVVLPGVTMAAGDRLRVRVQATGTSPTTVRAKAWKDGTTEPAAWTVTGTDSTAALQAAGNVGFYSYLSSSATNGPMVVRFDDVWVGPTQP